MNVLTRTQQAFRARQSAQHAAALAEKNYYREAVDAGKAIFADWTYVSHRARRIFVGQLLDDLEQKLNQWELVIQQAEEYIHQAQEYLRNDYRDPMDVTNLSEALALYKLALQQVNDQQVLNVAHSLQAEIRQRQRFQAFYKRAEQAAAAHFYHTAFKEYEAANELYPDENVQQKINSLCSKLDQEKKYEAILLQANHLARLGQFDEALNRLLPVQQTFPRQDGARLLKKLRVVLTAKQHFQLGLEAEYNQKPLEAQQFYAQIPKSLPPLYEEGQIRTGVVAVALHQWSAVTAAIAEIQSPQANYLRGFALAKQGALVEAQSAWNSLQHIEDNQAVLNQMVERSRLEQKQLIEHAIDNEQFELAEQQAHTFIAMFGVDTIVSQNLKGHIVPRLRAAFWQSKDWAEVYTQSEKIWLTAQTLEALHNLAVSAYYRTATNSDKDCMEAYGTCLITSWSMMIANICRDQVWDNLSWISREEIDFRFVRTQLQQLLEAQIERVKEHAPDTYIRLHDLLRHDRQAIVLLESAPQSNELTWTPNAAQRYTQFQSSEQISILNALFTDWGKAIAACLEGDFERAVLLQPTRFPKNNLEEFSCATVAYYQGSYSIQNQKWREALAIWQSIQSTISDQPDWQAEIDKYCCGILESLADSEQLEFAAAWYELLYSRAAVSNLTQRRVHDLVELLSTDQISLEKAQQRLRKYATIDPENPILLDLSNKISIDLELEKIDRFFRHRQYEMALKLAELSQHPEVRNRVARALLELTKHGIENRSLDIHTVTDLIGRAYQICPDDREIYEWYQASRNHLT